MTLNLSQHLVLKRFEPKTADLSGGQMKSKRDCSNCTLLWALSAAKQHRIRIISISSNSHDSVSSQRESTPRSSKKILCNTKTKLKGFQVLSDCLIEASNVRLFRFMQIGGEIFLVFSNVRRSELKPVNGSRIASTGSFIIVLVKMDVS